MIIATGIDEVITKEILRSILNNAVSVIVYNHYIQVSYIAIYSYKKHKTVAIASYIAGMVPLGIQHTLIETENIFWSD